MVSSEIFNAYCATVFEQNPSHKRVQPYYQTFWKRFPSICDSLSGAVTRSICNGRWDEHHPLSQITYHTPIIGIARKRDIVWNMQHLSTGLFDCGYYV